MKTLIIALAVGLFTSISSYNASMESLENATQQFESSQIQMLNSQINMYMGTNVKGTTVKDFLTHLEVFNNNDMFPVDIAVDGVTNILSSNFYTLESLDNNGDGYIDTVRITEN